MLDEVLEVIFAFYIKVDEEDEGDDSDLDGQGDEIGERGNGTNEISNDTRDVETANVQRAAFLDVFVVQSADKTGKQDVCDGKTEDVENHEESCEDVAGGDIDHEHEGRGEEMADLE